MRRAILVPFLVWVALAGPARAQTGDSMVGRAAVERAQRDAQPRSGGFLRHGWHVTKRGVVTGVLGAGLGYLIWGPAGAAEVGWRSAGAGVALHSLIDAPHTGIFKRSDRCFAMADLAEANGHCVRKHFYKLKGIFWSCVEGAVMNGVTTGGIGCLIGGPAGAVTGAATGASIGACGGLLVGAARAYAIPFFQRRSLGWSMRRAERALGRLSQRPDDGALRAEVAELMCVVQSKKDNIARLKARQAQQYQRIVEQAQRLPTLAALAEGLGR